MSDGYWIDLDELPAEGRRVLHLQGKDVVRFLQGTLSNDVADIGPDEAVPVTLLTPKGKIVSDGIAFRRRADAPEEGFGLAVPLSIAEDVAARLDRHIIMDDVTVEPEPALAVRMVWGAQVAGKAGRLRVMETRHPAPGQLLVGDRDAVEAVTEGLIHADAHHWTRYRIESASPAWGHEIAADVFPPEVGFVHAVSYDKGCFMGQEPLARIHARGQVNRVLVRVEVAGEVDLPSDLANDDRPDAGVLTSVAGDQGLAVVRRKAAQRDAVLRTPTGVEVTIRSEPLGDDPGMGGRHKGGATVKLGGR